MAYENFVHNVWHKGIVDEKERRYVFVDGCNRDFEGDVKNKGDKVTMHTLGEVTMKDLARGSVYTNIDAAEQLTSEDLVVEVDQLKYANVSISNIDEVQSDTKLRNKFAGKLGKGIAKVHDEFVANLSNQVGAHLMPVTAKLTAANVLDVILAAKTSLEELDVADTEMLELIVPPKFKTLLIKAGYLTDTNNSEILKHGAFGKIFDILVKSSNNVAKNTATIESDNAPGSLDMCQLRVRGEAVAFVEQITKVIPYRDEAQLDTDAMKAYTLFGGKVIFNDMFIVLPIKEYDLTTIVPAA